MNLMRQLLVVLLLVMGIVAGGCLPIELSASNGRIMIPRQEGFCILDMKKEAATKVVYAPKSDEAAMGLFAPDGKQFLAISQTTGGGMGSAFKIEVVQVADAKGKTLSTVTNLTYARWSPDGKRISLTRLADQKSAALDKNMPELLLLDPTADKKSKLASDVGIIHRWFPDSKSVLALQIASKAKEADQYSGKLVKIDVATGKAEPLASVLGGKKVFLDLSPDGGRVLFTAIKAAKAGGKVPSKSDDKPRLHELDIKSGAVRAVRGNVAYAIYSPKGTKVLVGSQSEKGGTIELAVGDASLEKFQTVATDAAKGAGGTGGSSDIYPGWLDDDTVHYIALHTVFGTAARNYQLITVSADGKRRANLQPVIDSDLMGK